ncbi:hypothetical protein [Agarilytica rhodophyticola]|uniref:hypothetical protein n=1 Tax=Agarilytica rhodophyticola TaxID=1737490 RepID=UPI000B3456FD|nr:hypothetical protein [Agarilytica rhodophyticola]
MKKSHIVLTTAIISLLVLQGISNVWFAYNINSNVKNLITQSQNTRKERGIRDEYSKQESTFTSFHLDNNTSKSLEKIIEQQVKLALADYKKALIHKKEESFTCNNKVAPVSDEYIDIRESEEAFSAATDIVSQALLQGDWDESVNEKLSIYSDKMTDAQRNKIVGKYIQAFKEGSISSGTIPPF